MWKFDLNKIFKQGSRQDFKMIFIPGRDVNIIMSFSFVWNIYLAPFNITNEALIWKTSDPGLKSMLMERQYVNY